MKIILITLVILEILIMAKCWQVIVHAWNSYGWKEFPNYMIGWITAIISTVGLIFTLSEIVQLTLNN